MPVTTGLVGSSLMIISSVDDPPFWSLHKILSEITCSEVWVVVVLCSMGTACHVSPLVLWVGLSKGVGMSEKVTLRNSIGRLVALCISDSLKASGGARSQWPWGRWRRNQARPEKGGDRRLTTLGPTILGTYKRMWDWMGVGAMMWQFQR